MITISKPHLSLPPPYLTARPPDPREQNLFPGRGAGCVNAVFDSAYNDRVPYGNAAGEKSEATLPQQDQQASHASAGDTGTGGGDVGGVAVGGQAGVATRSVKTACHSDGAVPRNGS